jgi:hypothetical protein
VTDRVDRDGEAVVLVGDDVVRLSVLACTLLDLCGDWVDTTTLTRELLSIFGQPPGGGDAAAAAEAALLTLRDKGLVEIG